jgi:UDP-N-acetylmuramoylalanine--D-glutamate ligase
MTMTSGPIDLDRLDLDAIRAGALRDRPVTVLGLARSGLALARFLSDAGARVTAYDGRPATALTDAIAALGGRSVTLALGPEVDPVATWAAADLVATSPSITPDFPTTEPRLRAALRSLVEARAGGDPTVPALVSEADLFLRLCPAPTIGVTGTKGKTTTSSLTAALLAADPAHPVVLGGNIGIPIVERLLELTLAHRVVDELSELQLPTLSRGTTVAVYTNVTSDHLDRHGTLEAYRQVKRRLAELVDPDGALVLNDEDPVVASYAELGTARAIRYRRDRPVPGGLGVVDGWIVADAVEPLALARGGAATPAPPRVSGRIMPVADLAIPGAHNVSNALAAIGVAIAFGIRPEAIRSAAAGFTGVEHRLEPAGVIDGVRFINDSQGTQPDAVAAALRAFEPPIVLIAGGRDKGIDLAALAPVVAERAVAAVLIGESGPALEASFRAAGLAHTERAGDLDEAVVRADAIAREALAARPADGPATVLLSPAAASFDMFEDYAARGRAFKAAVATLAASRTGDRNR